MLAAGGVPARSDVVIGESMYDASRAPEAHWRQNCSCVLQFVTSVCCKSVAQQLLNENTDINGSLIVIGAM